MKIILKKTTGREKIKKMSRGKERTARDEFMRYTMQMIN